MTIFFRTDSSLEIGAGHLIRCLALAIVLKKSGSDVTFICRKLEGHFGQFLEAYNLDVEWLSYISTNDKDQDQQRDAQATLKVLENCPEPIIVVDSYSLDEEWEKRLAPHSKRMVVIDDSGKSKHFCDVLIDTEITRTDAEHLNLVPKYCQVLVGSKYVMLRNDIIELRKKLNLKAKPVETILVSLGAFDQMGLIPKIIQLLRLNYSELNVKVIVSSKTSNFSEIKSLFRGTNVENLIVDATSIAEHLENVDLCIGSAGVGFFERASLGITGCIVPTSSDQLLISKEIGKQNLAFVVEPNNNFLTTLKIKIDKLLTKEGLLTQFSENCLNIIDSQGVYRVAEHILDNQK